MAIDLTKVITSAIVAGATQAAADPGTPLTHQEVPVVVDTAREVVENNPLVKEAQAQFDYATNNDSPFTSWGVNAAILAIASGLWQGYWTAADGVTVDDQTALFGALGSIISGVLFFVGRVRGKPIGA